MFSLMNNKGSKEKIFQELFMGNKFDWKIADIDDFLNGNEYDE
jgi:hypothetical protein